MECLKPNTDLNGWILKKFKLPDNKTDFDRLRMLYDHTLRFFDDEKEEPFGAIHLPGVYIQKDRIHVANTKTVGVIHFEWLLDCVI